MIYLQLTYTLKPGIVLNKNQSQSNITCTSNDEFLSLLQQNIFPTKVIITTSATCREVLISDYIGIKKHLNNKLNLLSYYTRQTEFWSNKVRDSKNIRVIIETYFNSTPINIENVSGVPHLISTSDMGGKTISSVLYLIEETQTWDYKKESLTSFFFNSKKKDSLIVNRWNEEWISFALFTLLLGFPSAFLNNFSYTYYGDPSSDQLPGDAILVGNICLDRTQFDRLLNSMVEYKEVLLNMNKRYSHEIYRLSSQLFVQLLQKI